MKTALTRLCFVVVVVSSPQHILQFYSGLSMVCFKKAILFHGFRGGPTFSRRVQLFPGAGGPTFSRGGPNAHFDRNSYNL